MCRVRYWWGSRHATRTCPDKELGQPLPGKVGGSQKTKVFEECRTKQHAPSGETQFKPEMAQNIAGATSTGMFCNELINYAARTVFCHLKKCEMYFVTLYPREKTCGFYLVGVPKLFAASRGPVINCQNTRHVIFKHMHGLWHNLW